MSTSTKNATGISDTTDATNKKLRTHIGQFKGMMTRYAKFVLEQEGQVLIDTEGAKLRMEELRKGLESYKKWSLELMMATDEEGCDGEVEDRYFAIMGKLRKIAQAAEAHPEKEECKQTVVSHGNKLPQLDITCFDGKDITGYTPFINVFKAVVHKEESLSPVQKLCYLRKYLKGDPLLLIEGLPLVNESYSPALELLNKRYNNKCLLITHHVNALLDCQSIPKGTSSELRHVVSIARQHLGALKNLGEQTQHWDRILIPILLRKLDVTSCREYHSDRDSSKLPTLDEFLDYMEKRAMSFEESQVSTGKSTSNKNHSSNNKLVNLTNACDNKTSTCKYCKDTAHKVFACREFQALSAQERTAFVEKEKLCRICLNTHTRKCKFHFKCSICKSKDHNSLLHVEETVCNLAKSTLKAVSNSMVLLPTIKVNFRAANGAYVTARGLVDSGSQVSLVNKNLISKLNLPTFNYNVNVTALGQIQKPVAKAVNLSMHSMHSNFSCNALFSVVDNITTYLPQTRFDISGIELPDSVILADNEFNIPGEISFLMSSDILFEIILAGKISLPKNNLFLLATKFGYIVSGKLYKDNVCLTSQNIPNQGVVLHAIMNEEKIDSLLQRFWEEQHTPELKDESVHDSQEFCETNFQNTVQLNDHRFQVSLPLKVPLKDVNLGNSFNVALQRLNVLCKKFSKDQNLKSRYIKFIDEYVKAGRAKKVDLFQLGIPFESCYFLPHHAVIKERSTTTKLRVVFDASAKTTLNKSLNDILHSGPVVQKELFEILISFRTHKYVILTDVKRMYEQVTLDPAHTHLQSILWKENLNDPLLCFQLQTVTYGVTSSSFLATRCLVELARRYEDQYPLASAVLRNNSYIDDCLFGAPSIEQAKAVCSELTKLTALGSFELHKWCASHPDILADIPSSEQHFKEIDLNNASMTIGALGLLLDINSDQLIISQPCGQLSKVWTKRTVLSFIGTFFDPLGLAGPIVTRAKEFMQKVWRQNLDWDTMIPEELLLHWRSFFNDLISMKPIYVKRSLAMDSADYLDIVGYCDASSIAYGACLYIRAIQGNNVSVNLLCSKSRIAPLKTKQTIPRLELNACLLLAKMYAKIDCILSNYSFKNRVLLSDSQIALCWLQKPPTKDVYVRNRVMAVSELTKDCIWSHVSGSCNPADCLSRGSSPSELDSNTLWWHGPPELLNYNFAVTPFGNKEMSSLFDDRKEQSVNCNVIDEVIPTSKFSSLLKMQRVVCYMLRFIKNCKAKKEDRMLSKILNVSEYRQSMSTIIKNVQALHFSEEILMVERNLIVKSNLKKLSPFLDKEGILRVGGRLDNANISFEQKHPIILPKDCNFTRVLIRNEHCALMHAGLRLTLSNLSQKYYIISATTLVKSVINKCVTCFRYRAQNAQQLMASLPQDRVVQDRVFNKVGIDYCGPFSVKQSSMRRSVISKGYVCIFVCFVTKCVHLELVSDLTSECFLAALKRFQSRRGLPQTIYCDNASTFKGANNQLKELYVLCKSQAHQNAVIEYCNIKGIDFKFIPSYSPTWGGLWEAAVKSAKYHFKRIIGALLFTYEQFNTIIVQVEGILNSRPITPINDDVSDFSYLTPGHFLINQSLAAIPEPGIATTANVNYLSFWKKCTRLQQDFWLVWHKSYLSQMLSRPKWFKKSHDIQEGALVLLLGLNVPPLQWPLARVTKVFRSKSDNIVRSVEVITKTGSVHTRAINKVAVLPIYA